MSDKIDITGIDHAELLAALSNGSHPVGTRDELRDAVIEAARKLLRMRTEWVDAGGDALDDGMPEECVEQVDRVCDLVAVLEAHEGEQVS